MYHLIGCRSQPPLPGLETVNQLMPSFNAEVGTAYPGKTAIFSLLLGQLQLNNLADLPPPPAHWARWQGYFFLHRIYSV